MCPIPLSSTLSHSASPAGGPSSARCMVQYPAADGPAHRLWVPSPVSPCSHSAFSPAVGMCRRRTASLSLISSTLFSAAPVAAQYSVGRRYLVGAAALPRSVFAGHSAACVQRASVGAAAALSLAAACLVSRVRGVSGSPRQRWLYAPSLSVCRSCRPPSTPGSPMCSVRHLGDAAALLSWAYARLQALAPKGRYKGELLP